MDVGPDSNDSPLKEQPGSSVGAGLVIGTGVGVAIGVALDNVAIGIAVGVGVGLIFGSALEGRRKQEDRSNRD